jgi:hypothetical protein
MNNDYLGLHYQVIDLNVISLADGQWHSICDFRRDSPTNRPDAGNSNRIFVSIARRLIAAMSCLPRSNAVSSAAEAATFAR